MKKRQRSILLLTEWADERYYHGVACYAKQANWHLNIDYVYGRSLPTSWKGDGCISLVSSKEAVAFKAALGVPEPGVVGDPEGNGSEAADYFAGLGFRHFACYATDYAAEMARRRIASYHQRLAERGFEATILGLDRSAADDLLDWEQRKARLADHLHNLPKPVAVFCVDDRMALRVVEACLAVNIEVPTDVAVLGVGNLELACECSPVPLSSIRIDFEKMGYESAAQLDRILDGEPPRPVQIPSGGIEERRSTYTLAVADPAGRHALRFMLDHYRDPISINDIARAGGLSRWQLAYLTGKELNTTPGKLLADIRLKKACELLKTTGYPVKRIAYETGLGTALSLQRLFRKRFRTTPRAWRKAEE